MSSCLDLEVLEELVDIMGDDMQMLLESYFADSTAKIDELGQMDLQTEQEKIFRMAHALKGSSRNVGVVDFSNLCEKIEKFARDENLTSEVFDFENLKALHHQATEELKQRYF